MKKKHKDLKYFLRMFSIAIGIVLVWRGVWHVVDIMDDLWFGGERIWTAVGGFFLGMIILYIPDRDLDEIEKL